MGDLHRCMCMPAHSPHGGLSLSINICFFRGVDISDFFFFFFLSVLRNDEDDVEEKETEIPVSIILKLQLLNLIGGKNGGNAKDYNALLQC